MAKDKQNKRPQQPNLQDTSKVESNQFFKGMTKDPDMVLVGKENWTHAINAINNSALGDVGVIGNEPANLLCADVPYEIIGGIHLFGDKWVLFSTDDTSSEIGIFDDSKCEYRTFVNDDCLNFNRRYLVTGASKENFDCSWQVYWDDHAHNPSRTLNLGPLTDDGWFTDINVPWFKDSESDGDNCITYVNAEPLALDCDLIRLAPLMDTPCINVLKSESGGQLKNGSYQVFIAYTLNENKIGDYIAYSDVQPLWDHDDMSGSLEIKITNLDTNFEFFELVVVFNHQMQQLAKRIGYYSTVTSDGNFREITLDFIDPKLQTIDIETLPAQNPRYERSDKMYPLNDYLIRQGPYEQFDFNYQCQANNIDTMWVSTQYPDTYYRKGGNKPTFMRDEQYAFFIRFVYTTGERSSSYHIPGRDPNVYPDGTPVLPAQGGDTGNGLVATYAIPGSGESENWEVVNTAIEVVGAPGIGATTDDGGVVIAKGYMGYWQSSETYPSTDQVRWCELCGDNIRHHKMPDENTCLSTERSVNTANGSFINILGVEFTNITRPTNNDGSTITNISGYEILVGSRKGAKSIVAKGLFRNMRSYNPNVGDPETGQGVTGIFPNFPFNDQHPDFYHLTVDSATTTIANQPNFLLDNQATGGGTINDIFTFHSPETSFNRPFLSPYEVKSYGITAGFAAGRFKRSEDHPKHKLIRDIVAIIAAIIGAGYAIQEMRGEKVQRVKGTSALSIGKQSGPYDNRNQDYHGEVTQAPFTVTTSPFWTPLMGGATISASGGGNLGYDGLAIDDDFQDIPMDDAAPPAGPGNPLGSIVMDGSAPGAPNSMVADNATHNMLDLETGQQQGGVGQEDATSALIVDSSTLTTIDPMSLLPPFLGGTAPQESSMIMATTPVDPTTSVGGAEEEYLQDINEKNEDAAMDQNTRGYTGPNREIESRGSKYKGLPGFLQIMFKIHSFLNMMVTGGQEIVELVYNLMSPQDYVYKYNGYGLYFNHLCQYHPNCNGTGQPNDGWTASNNRAEINKAVYISNAFQNLDATFRINNLQRPKTVVVQTLQNLPDVGTAPIVDTSRQTIGSLTSHMNPTAGFMTTITGHYVALKLSFENQYGQLDGIIQLPSGCVVDFDGSETVVQLAGPPVTSNTFTSPVIFGGDCYLNRYSEKVIMPFFWDFLKGEPDEFNFNYYEHQNIPNTRFWYNGDRYNLSGLVQPMTDLTFTWLSDPNNPGLPSAMHNLDRSGTDAGYSAGAISSPGTGGGTGWGPGTLGTGGTGVAPGGFWSGGGGLTPAGTGQSEMEKNGMFTIKGAYMYVHSSGINEFYVESEINTALRDWEDERGKRHYDWQEFADLTELFHADIVKDGNYYKYDHSLSISNFFTQALSFGFIQDLTYDPIVAENCLTHYPKRVIYSLQAQKEAKKDFWRVFLPNNKRDFKNPVNVLKPISKTGALILFPHLAPQQFQGVDTLQTEGDIKITIGDAGLFNQPMQNIVNTDLSHEYGSCESMRSVINTPTGLYYISQEQGKIFNYSGQLEAISDIGMKQWFNRYLPSQLIAAFPNMENTVDADNPVVGVGCQSVYDPNFDLVYFCKKDYAPIEDNPCLQYDPQYGFVINNTECYGLDQTLQCPDDSYTLLLEGETHPITNDVLTSPLCCNYDSWTVQDTEEPYVECNDPFIPTGASSTTDYHFNEVNTDDIFLTNNPSNTIAFEIPDNIIEHVKNNRPNNLSIEIPFFNNEKLSLSLKRFRVLTKDFKAVKQTKKGNVEIPYITDVKSYRVMNGGDLAGSISFSKKALTGIVTKGNRIYDIVRLDANRYALVWSDDLKNNIAYECGTDDNYWPVYGPDEGGDCDSCRPPKIKAMSRAIKASRKARGGSIDRCITMAIDLDHYTYMVSFASNEQDTIDWAVSVVAGVSEVYQNSLNTAVLVNFVYLRTEYISNPYTSSSTTTLIRTLQDQWTQDPILIDAVPGNSVIHLLSTGFTGGKGYISGLCKFDNVRMESADDELIPHSLYQDAYGVNGTGGYTIAAVDPDFAWVDWANSKVIQLMSHELGHNMGSHHTHYGYCTGNYGAENSTPWEQNWPNCDGFDGYDINNGLWAPDDDYNFPGGIIDTCRMYSVPAYAIGTNYGFDGGKPPRPSYTDYNPNFPEPYETTEEGEFNQPILMWPEPPYGTWGKPNIQDGIFSDTDLSVYLPTSEVGPTGEGVRFFTDWQFGTIMSYCSHANDGGWLEDLSGELVENSLLFHPIILDQLVYPNLEWIELVIGGDTYDFQTNETCEGCTVSCTGPSSNQLNIYTGEGVNDSSYPTYVWDQETESWELGGCYGLGIAQGCLDCDDNIWEPDNGGGGEENNIEWEGSIDDCTCECLSEGYNLVFAEDWANGIYTPATPEDCLLDEVDLPEFVEAEIETMEGDIQIIPAGEVAWTVENPSFELQDADYQHFFELHESGIAGEMFAGSCGGFPGPYNTYTSEFGWGTWEMMRDIMQDNGSYGAVGHLPLPWIRCQQDTTGALVSICPSITAGAPPDPITGIVAFTSDSFPSKYDVQRQAGIFLNQQIFYGPDEGSFFDGEDWVNCGDVYGDSNCQGCGYCGGSWDYTCWHPRAYFPFPSEPNLPLDCFSFGQSAWGTDGPGYIGLTHGAAGCTGTTNWQEGASQQLSTPLVQGAQYTGSIDIRRPWIVDCEGNPSDVTETGRLILLGGNVPCCLDEILWISESTSTQELNEWVTHEFEFSPQLGNWQYIQFMIETDDDWFLINGTVEGNEYSAYPSTGDLALSTGGGGPATWQGPGYEADDRPNAYLMIDNFSGFAAKRETEVELPPYDVCDCPAGYQGIEWPIADGEDPIVYTSWEQFEIDCLETDGDRVMCQLITTDAPDVICVYDEFFEEGECVPPVIGDDITEVDLTDENYFKDVSWTVSYDPKAKAWISFHDWHPDLVFPSLDHFLTTKFQQYSEPICPPGFILNDDGLCELNTVQTVPGETTYDYYPCREAEGGTAPMDIVFSLDASGSTGGPAQADPIMSVQPAAGGIWWTGPGPFDPDNEYFSIWSEQLIFVNKFIEEITPYMESGDVQVGVRIWGGDGGEDEDPWEDVPGEPDMYGNWTAWSINTTPGTASSGLQYSMTDEPWVLDQGNTPFPSYNMNTAIDDGGINPGFNQLIDPENSALGDRSSEPGYRRLLIVMTDMEHNAGNALEGMFNYIGNQGTEVFALKSNRPGHCVDELESDYDDSFGNTVPAILKVAGYCGGNDNCGDAWDDYNDPTIPTRAYSFGPGHNWYNTDGTIGCTTILSGGIYTTTCYQYTLQDWLDELLANGSPSAYPFLQSWNQEIGSCQDDPVIESLIGEIAFQPPISECNCPGGYVEVGVWDPSSDFYPPNCVSIECTCKDVIPGVPLEDITESGECDNPEMWGWANVYTNPATPYINQNPFMCTYGDVVIVEPSNTGGSIWRHNVRCDVFSNYYYVQYPWEIEFVESTGQMVNTVRNVEYELECYLYQKARDAEGELLFGYSDCDSRWHDLDHNFNRAFIYNTEQVSGYLHLNLSPKNNAPEINQYPIINVDPLDNNNSFIDILFSKEEQKYRFNQFWDITANRGEIIEPLGQFDSNAIVAQQAIMWTDLNGYIRDLNSLNLEYDKPPTERKKFRHYWNKIVLGREPEIDGDGNVILETRKMLLKLDNTKINLSIR